MASGANFSSTRRYIENYVEPDQLPQNMRLDRNLHSSHYN